MPRPTQPAAGKAAGGAEAERQITLSVADSSSGHGVFQHAVIRCFKANAQSNLESVMDPKQSWYPSGNMDYPSEMLCGIRLLSPPCWQRV